jgi:hypothetical protein
MCDTERIGIRPERIQAQRCAGSCSSTPWKSTEQIMHLNLSLTPLVSLLAGIIILIVPRMLNFIVAAYLIIIGLIGLFGGSTLHLH